MCKLGIIIFVLISFYGRGQYVRSFNFPDMTGGLGLAPTQNGGFVGTGQHNGGSGGSCDSYVYKLNTCGELLWYRTYGTAGSDGGRTVRESLDGGLLVSGLFDSDGGNDYDYFIQKLDASGNQLWLTVWNNGASNLGDHAHWVAETASQVFVSGSTNGSPWAGWNAVISSYSPLGVHMWTKAFGGGGEDNFCSIHAVSDGVIAGGITASYGSGGRDLFVAKTDFSGNVDWMNAYGTAGNEGGYWDTEGIPTNDGGYLMTGSTNTAGLTGGGMDILLIKLDSLGVVEWAKTYGGPNNDWSEGLVVSPSGGYAIVGTSESYTNGGRDAVLLKVDSLGGFEWANSYGQTGCDRGVDVINKEGGYVLSMNYNNSLADCGVNNEYDPMFIKTDSLGSCGCSFINAPYVSMDVTTSIITTVINPATATEVITANLQISSPPIIQGTPNITQNTICTVCSNVTPQWGYNDTIGCHGDTLKFYNTTTSSVGCFYWDNSISYSSNGDTILFVLDSTLGLTQDVALISVCGNNIDTLKQRVTVSHPIANYSIGNSCLIDTTIFVDNSTLNIENINRWEWSFGDGNNSVNQNDFHQYIVDGNYQIELVVTSDHGCTDTLKRTITKFPMPQPQASLSNECLIDSIYFEDASLINSPDVISSWVWDFGDGTTSLSQDVYHTYTSDGIYIVKLITVSNNLCADTLIDSVVVYPMPVANVLISNECIYDSLILNDISTINAPDVNSAWNWDFGDGGTSVSQNTKHLFSLDGAYEVSLITTSNHGCSDTLRDSVVIYPVPATNFTLANHCQVDTFLFGDLSFVNPPDTIATWTWSFGDGAGDNNKNATHYYASDGAYDVKLITKSNNNCYDTLVLPLIVYPMPQSNFELVNQCIVEEYLFNSLSIINGPDNIVGWEWEFGDGNGGFQDDESHYYTSNGDYQVSLVTTSNNGCKDTLVDSLTIYPMPNSIFNLSNICYTDTISFSDLSFINVPDNIVVRQWSFGDGSVISLDSVTSHVYQNSGVFDVSLITVSNNNCRDTLVQSMEVYPLPSVEFITSSACINEQPINFTNQSTITSGTNDIYLWNFDDNLNSTSGLENSSFNYLSHGVYNVMLTVSSNLNCKDSIQKMVNVFQKPTAYFIEDTTEGCVPLCVTFNSISTDGLGIVSWDWKFENSLGEGGSKYVGYCYEESGNYDVTLIVRNVEGCYDTIIKPTLITTYPFPLADFELSPSSTTVLTPEVTFTNTSIDAVSWFWNFADGSVDSINFNPIHDYQDTGVYNVQLTVYNNIGCPNTVYHELIVLPIENTFVPSAFSPNNDGENDLLFVRGYAQAMYFSVYDRWGKKVFETTNQSQGWDGKFNNKSVVEGVYMWYLQTSYNGNNKVYKGDVSLFR